MEDEKYIRAKLSEDVKDITVKFEYKDKEHEK